MEAIELVNWLMLRTQPKDIKQMPIKTRKELFSLKERLVRLLDTDKGKEE